LMGSLAAAICPAAPGLLGSGMNLSKELAALNVYKYTTI
jgi:hypothetical protein